MKRQYPSKHEKANIYEIRGARLSRSVKLPLRNLHEQALIAVFRHGILNSQQGGVGLILSITQTDRDSFALLETNLLERIAALTPTFAPQHIDCVNDYATAIQIYATFHPDTTNAKNAPFTDAVREVVAQQAFARSISQTEQLSLMLIVGADPTLESFINPKQFLSRGCYTSDMICGICNQSAAWETGEDDFTDVSDFIDSIQGPPRIFFWGLPSQSSF